MEKLYSTLQKMNSRLIKGPDINLLGDRDIEWSWVASQMPSGPGLALDFGCGKSYLALIAARKGLEVTAVDLQHIQMPYKYPTLSFIQGDVIGRLPKEHFDLVINCSVIEHIGLVGRYTITKNLPGGDLEKMMQLRQLMKKGGVMILTIPVGRDVVFAPLHRVYGKERLPRLLDGYIVEKQEFWIKNTENRWVTIDKDTAINYVASWDNLKKVYGLGLFVLKKPL